MEKLTKDELIVLLKESRMIIIQCRNAISSGEYNTGTYTQMFGQSFLNKLEESIKNITL